ncbi:MAG: HEAT repeat domain-containing protein, partial [Lysinibacillus sp.]
STLYKMRDYQMSFLLPNVEEMLQKPKSLDIDEYVIILKILSVYNRDLFLAHLFEPKLPLGEFEYIKLIHQLDESYFDMLLEQFDELPINLSIAFIVVIGYQAKSDSKDIMFLEELLSSSNSELRVRALKSLTKIGAFHDFGKYKEFVQSEVWEERLMFAKMLVNVQEPIARPYLEKLIEDDTWWVRKQAATTLSNIKNGAQSLEHIIKFSNDRYAVDMAKELLGEG